MMVFLYFRERLPCGLDEIEDRLDEALDGRGEVTGSGSGTGGSNIDITIFRDELGQAEVLGIIRRALSGLDIPPSSVVSLDGRREPL